MLAPVNAGSDLLAFGLDLAADLMTTAGDEVVDQISTQTDPRANKAGDCNPAAAPSAKAGGAAWRLTLPG